MTCGSSTDGSENGRSEGTARHVREYVVRARRAVPLLFAVILLASLLTACANLPITITVSSPTPTPTHPSSTSNPQPVTPTVSPTPTSSTFNLQPATPVDVGEQRIIRVYKEIGPSVVNITTRVIEYSFFFGPVPSEGAGSGFLWDREGHIVTNFHVIEGAQSIEVSFSEEDVMPAKVVGADPSNDLAVLKVPRVPEGLIPLSVRLGDSDKLQVGQRAIAIGNPFGRFDRTLTAGVISALNRTLDLGENRRLRRAIQTDAAINRGNSGGPLLDGDGRLIGVNTAIFSPTGTSAGIGFAIPVNTVKRVVPVLIKLGRYPHPWLGAIGYSITPYLARALDLPVEKGLLVARVYRGSPAAKAGLRGATHQVVVGNNIVLAGGDIITAVDGRPVKEWDELEDYLELEKQVGDSVVLTVLRDGKELQVKVVLEEAPR